MPAGERFIIAACFPEFVFADHENIRMSWPRRFAFFGHFALAKAYSLADASFIAALDYARLPFAALIGWLMFAEFSDIWTWIGASIIFGSAFYIVRREVQLARQRAAPGSKE